MLHLAVTIIWILIAICVLFGLYYLVIWVLGQLGVAISDLTPDEAKAIGTFQTSGAVIRRVEDGIWFQTSAAARTLRYRLEGPAGTLRHGLAGRLPRARGEEQRRCE